MKTLQLVSTLMAVFLPIHVCLANDGADPQIVDLSHAYNTNENVNQPTFSLSLGACGKASARQV